MIENIINQIRELGSQLFIISVGLGNEFWTTKRITFDTGGRVFVLESDYEDGEGNTLWVEANELADNYQSNYKKLSEAQVDEPTCYAFDMFMSAIPRSWYGAIRRWLDHREGTKEEIVEDDEEDDEITFDIPDSRRGYFVEWAKHLIAKITVLTKDPDLICDDECSVCSECLRVEFGEEMGLFLDRVRLAIMSDDANPRTIYDALVAYMDSMEYDCYSGESCRRCTFDNISARDKEIIAKVQTYLWGE